MRNIKTIDLSDAQAIVDKVLSVAKNDGGEPVAVAVVGSDGRLVAFAAMGGVMPVSVELAINKAYTAVMGQRPTLVWEQKPAGFDGRNFTDPRFTCFGGGVPIISPDVSAGAVGVSGRHSSKANLPDTAPSQDHELACLGRDWLPVQVL